jgi:hypothetical protein
VLREPQFFQELDTPIIEVELVHARPFTEDCKIEPRSQKFKELLCGLVSWTSARQWKLFSGLTYSLPGNWKSPKSEQN